MRQLYSPGNLFSLHCYIFKWKYIFIYLYSGDQFYQVNGGHEEMKDMQWTRLPSSEFHPNLLKDPWICL